MTTADIVNTWFRERIACAAIARDTPAYNQAFGALPDLIARLDPPVVVTPPSGKTIAPEGDEHSA